MYAYNTYDLLILNTLSKVYEPVYGILQDVDIHDIHLFNILTGYTCRAYTQSHTHIDLHEVILQQTSLMPKPLVSCLSHHAGHLTPLNFELYKFLRVAYHQRIQVPNLEVLYLIIIRLF